MAVLWQGAAGLAAKMKDLRRQGMNGVGGTILFHFWNSFFQKIGSFRTGKGDLPGKLDNQNTWKCPFLQEIFKRMISQIINFFS